MRRYEVTLTGVTPLLMHADSVEWADRMEAWKNDPANKKISRAGDDRTPAYRWFGCLYHDEGSVVIPADNLQTVMAEGGALVPVPGGRSGKTFKAQTQSGIVVDDASWPLLLDGGAEVKMSDLEPLMSEADFAVHRETVIALGFSLFVKRARVGQSKHIRVRPRFDVWSCGGTVTVLDDQITDQVLADVWSYAGTYKGLGDWRPGSPRKPGPWGRFTAEVAKVE